jgi:hypothetical protein
MAGLPAGRMDALGEAKTVAPQRPLALPIVAFLVTPGSVISVCLTECAARRPCCCLPPLVLLAVPGVDIAATRCSKRLRLVRHDHLQLLRLLVVGRLERDGIRLAGKRLARQASRLEPGFSRSVQLASAVGFAMLASVVWCWLIVTSPRSPMRGIMHWMAGLTLFWLLIAALWMPWIDYGKTYRPLSASLAKALARASAAASPAPTSPIRFSPRSTISTAYARFRQNRAAGQELRPGC